MKINTKGGVLLIFMIWITAYSAQAFDHIHTLRATTLQYPPYEYLEDGVAKGLAVEILQEAVRRTGIEGVDIEFFPWKRAVYSIEFGDKQVIFNAGKNQARQKWGIYSEHVLILQKYYLFARKGSGLQTTLKFDNLREKRIAIRNGYLYGSGPFKKSITMPGTYENIDLTDSTDQSVKLLLGGRVDMFVGDYFPVAHYLLENNLQDEVEIITDLETQEPLNVLTWPTYFLFSKKNVPLEYYNRFEAALKEMIDDGTYQAIYDKYNLTYRLQ